MHFLLVLFPGVGEGPESVLGQSGLGSMAVEKSSDPETKMERREGNAMPFHRVYNSSILGYPTYRVR